MRKKGKDPDDFHIEILDFNQDREVYDGSLEENIISQVEEPGTIPVRPAPQRPQQRVQRKKVRRPENLDDFQEEKLPPSPKEKARRKRNRQLTALTYGFVALFICMMAYLVYFNQVRARSFIRDPHNARLDSMAEHIARGPIVDRNGQVLAETVTTDNGEQYRNYPYGSLFAHVVGYDTKGKAGLESVFNFELLTSHASYLEQHDFGIVANGEVKITLNAELSHDMPVKFILSDGQEVTNDSPRFYSRENIYRASGEFIVELAESETFKDNKSLGV